MNKNETGTDGAQTTVKRSTAGLGLFSAEPIKKGDFIIEYTGEIISAEEADRRGGKYLFDLEKGRVLDGKDRGNKARYINHACKPNAEAVLEDNERVYIYAKKNIKEGEEITYHYGKEYVDDQITPYGCRCTVCLDSSR